jgi:protein XagA
MKAASPLFSAALAFGLCAFAAGSALAGAWTQKKGEGQIIAGATLTRSTHGFDDDGGVVQIPRYDKLEANLLVEYGVTDWLTTILQPQLLGVDIDDPVDANTLGPGYTDLGARARLWSDETSVFSAQVLGRLPGRFDGDNPAEIGKTAAELDLRLLYGHGFTVEGMNAFVNSELGYRFRFDDPPNEVRADFTFGIRPDPKLLLLAQSFNTVSDGSAHGVFVDGTEHKIQLSVVWSLDHVWSLQLGSIATVIGENSLRERGVVAAVWRKF